MERFAVHASPIEDRAAANYPLGGALSEATENDIRFRAAAQAIRLTEQENCRVDLNNRQSGKPFGGVYFGTRGQMKQIEKWDVGYYLD